jgi:hypothetical protein
MVGNGGLLPITATGSASLVTTGTPLKLSNVLLSPSLIKNLLSVRQLTRENPVSVEFDAFGFSVKDIRTKVVILRCDSDGDLYPVSPAFSRSSRRPFAGVASATCGIKDSVIPALLLFIVCLGLFALHVAKLISIRVTPAGQAKMSVFLFHLQLAAHISLSNCCI